MTPAQPCLVSQHSRLGGSCLEGRIRRMRLDVVEAQLFEGHVLFGQVEGSLGIDPGAAPMEFANGPDLDWLINFCITINIDVEVH